MEEMEEKFLLPKKSVLVKPNYQNPGWIKKPNHKAFFMIDGASMQLTAPLNKSGGLFNVLTKSEKETLESILEMNNNELSVYKKDNNYWHNLRVRLTKEPLKLDLSNPFDYIKYKVLLANKDIIAPSVKNIKDKATYKFYIEDKDELNELKAKESTTNAKVWSLYGKLSVDRQKMLDVIYIYAESFGNVYKSLRNIDVDSKIEFLQTELSKIVEKDKLLFLEVMNDPNFDVKLLLSKAVKKGLINRIGEAYTIKDDPNPFAKSFQDACKYLKNDVNQDFVLTLQERLK